MGMSTTFAVQRGQPQPRIATEPWKYDRADWAESSHFTLINYSWHGNKWICSWDIRTARIKSSKRKSLSWRLQSLAMEASSAQIHYMWAPHVCTQHPLFQSRCGFFWGDGDLFLILTSNLLTLQSCYWAPRTLSDYNPGCLMEPRQWISE